AVTGVDDLDDVTDAGVLEEPGGVGGGVARAADVLEADAAVAGVGVAEDALAPVVAVDEGAGRRQAHGVRDVGDVVFALAVLLDEADGGAVHPGLLEAFGDDHLAVVGRVLLGARGARD